MNVNLTFNWKNPLLYRPYYNFVLRIINPALHDGFPFNRWEKWKLPNYKSGNCQLILLGNCNQTLKVEIGLNNK